VGYEGIFLTAAVLTIGYVQRTWTDIRQIPAVLRAGLPF
jgi:hypothetical protein